MMVVSPTPGSNGETELQVLSHKSSSSVDYDTVTGWTAEHTDAMLTLDVAPEPVLSQVSTASTDYDALTGWTVDHTGVMMEIFVE